MSSVSHNKAAKAVWTRLVERDFPAGIYRGKLSPSVRDETQDAFMHGRFVAAKAFGMLIDKPDTRLVVHYHLAGSETCWCYCDV